MKTNNFTAAIEHFRQALLENGKMRTALLGMGRCYVNLDNLEKAIYYFKRLRRHHPSSTKPLEAIVKYALEHDSPKQAEITLRNEKKSFPKRLDTYVVLAKFYAATNRNKEGVDQVLSKIKAKTLAIAISSDQLFPPVEQKRIAEAVPEGKYVEIDSFYGHDGFLIEVDGITKAVKNFLNQTV